MEQLTPEQNPQAPEQERQQQPQTFSLKLPAFFSQISKEDVRWYYDVRLWIPVILVAVILSAFIGSKLSTPKPEDDILVMETQSVEPVQQPQETQAPTLPPVDPEAEALAVLADSVGFNRSYNVKTIIMWVAINRSEDYANGHGKSLVEEIERPNQWQGYDPNMGYSQKTYEIALEVLNIRDTGGLRPLDGDMLWMVLNDDGSVTLRNQFTFRDGESWREKTVK